MTDLTKVEGLLGMSDYPVAIGDCLTYSALPENYFHNTGKKLALKTKNWMFKHNPFIDRSGTKLDGVLAIRTCYDKFVSEIAKEGNFTIFFSHTQFVCRAFGLKCFQRNPRLYKFEDNKTEPNTLVFHSFGFSNKWKMDNDIIDILRNNYKGWQIIQVGGAKDKVYPDLGAEDRRGTSLWEMVEIISKAAVFIGPSSGPLHIANCFDKVRKKVLIPNDEEQLYQFIPGVLNSGCPGAEWTDFNWEYYNFYNNDIGITRSIEKI